MSGREKRGREMGGEREERERKKVGIVRMD